MIFSAMAVYEKTLLYNEQETIEAIEVSFNSIKTLSINERILDSLSIEF